MGSEVDHGFSVRYAVVLELDATSGAAAILRSVQGWLRNARKETIPIDMLTRSGSHGLSGGALLEIQVAESSAPPALPYLYAFRYSHPDIRIPGRRWVTEIGLRTEPGAAAISTSVVLGTEDISSTELEAAAATRPRVVTDLLEQNRALPNTPGLTIQQLSLENAPAFRTAVFDAQRQHPIVLISAPIGGAPLVDPRKLHRLTAGLADIVVINSDVDTRRLADVVGDGVIPWGGGVRIAYPALSTPYRDQVRTSTIRPDTLDDWRIEGRAVPSEVFSLVALRTARSNGARHVSLTVVREEKLRRRFRVNSDRLASEVAVSLSAMSSEARALSEQNKQLEEDIKAYDEMVAERDQRIGDLEADLLTREIEVDELRDDLHSAKQKLSAQEHAIGHLRDRPQAADDALDPKAKDALLALMAGRADLAQMLRIAVLAYPGRAVVLESAWKSADAASAFRKVDKASDLLTRLLGQYWESLSSGLPDSQAKAAFPAGCYAPTESEQVKNNAGARKRRTFSYKNQDVVMLAHLKIGAKPSISETLRIHFHWDADSQVIVIGHCGQHLNFD
jgi:hypothetical protein